MIHPRYYQYSRVRRVSCLLGICGHEATVNEPRMVTTNIAAVDHWYSSSSTGKTSRLLSCFVVPKIGFLLPERRTIRYIDERSTRPALVRCSGGGGLSRRAAIFRSAPNHPKLLLTHIRGISGIFNTLSALGDRDVDPRGLCCVLCPALCSHIPGILVHRVLVGN